MSVQAETFSTLSPDLASLGSSGRRSGLRESSVPSCPQIDALITKMAMLMTGADLPFTLVLEDPAGNSFVENPQAPAPDPRLKVTYFVRTPMQVGDDG